MARQIVFTSKVAKPSPTYSHVVKAAGLVFVSGTAPIEFERSRRRVEIAVSQQVAEIAMADLRKFAGHQL
jgi:enamine deaminase RidA (YjgF/YER057c/UK114 family)